MMKKAKTYYSTNGWTGPESLSDFGIPITCRRENVTLGLEEFNGLQLLRKNKLAFIPAFSSRRNIAVDELKLFYSVPGQTYHYGTMKNVRQIDVGGIAAVRANLGDQFTDTVNVAFFQSVIYANCNQQAFGVWMKYYKSNNILATGHNLRFVVNVKYEKFELFHTPIEVDWTNLKRATSLYPRH